MRPEAETKITNRLKALGFESLRDYLAARPAVPYTELAEELGDGVLGLHIATLHVRQAEDKRSMAADALARALRQVLVQGWDRTPATEPGVTPDFVTITAWSYWVSLLDTAAPAEDVMDRLWDGLKARARPGWIPTGPSDPIIAATFDEAWPVR